METPGVVEFQNTKTETVEETVMLHVDANQLFFEQKRLADCAVLLAQATERTTFEESVLTVLERYLMVDHFAVFAEAQKMPLRLIAAGSRKRDGVSSAIAQIYTLRFSHADPVPQAMAAASRQQHILVRNLHASEVRDPSYRYECYDKPGITERLTIGSFDDGSWQLLNLYRQTAPFHEADVVQALRAAACILAARPTHKAIANSDLPEGKQERLAWFIIRLRALPNHLTAREIEVCARALLGMTVEGTGLDLGIASTSVATYRKRAYQRLGISSQNELFALLH